MAERPYDTLSWSPAASSGACQCRSRVSWAVRSPERRVSPTASCWAA